jgi:hypothetical protein
MNTPNPFQPPSANFNEAAPSLPDASSGVPPSVVAILRETRPWLLLMLGLLVTGLALVGLAVLGLGVGSWFMPGARHSTMSLTVVLPFLVMMLIYVPPVVYLGRCASGIRRLQEGGGLPALEDALRNQKSFWRYLGVLILVLIALYALYAIVFVVMLARGS